MRRLLLLLGLTSVVSAEPGHAPSVAAYYQGKAASSESLPTAEDYRLACEFLAGKISDPVSEADLAAGVCWEVDLMLAALDVRLDLRNIPRDLGYPFALSLRGRVNPGLSWLAACQGLVRAADPREGEFFTQAEWDGLPHCGSGYYGPPRYPRR